MQQTFKFGDIVRYRYCKTEYRITCLKHADSFMRGSAQIELIKLDPRRTTERSIIGEKFNDVFLRKLELVYRAKSHPLTTIFK